VNEQDGGHAGIAGKVIQQLALGRAVAHVLQTLSPGQQQLAARIERSQLPGTVVDGRCVVVGSIAAGGMQAREAFQVHAAARVCITWLDSMSVSSWRTRLNSGVVMQR